MQKARLPNSSKRDRCRLRQSWRVVMATLLILGLSVACANAKHPFATLNISALDPNTSPLWSSLSYAIGHNLQGKLVLVLKSCTQTQSAQAQLQALTTWKKTLGEKPGPLPKLKKNPDGTCEYEIEGLVPEFARLHCDQTPACSGPNCFNTCLVSKKLAPQLRYTSPEEIEFWINSPNCKKLKNRNQLQPGDFIYIRQYSLTTPTPSPTSTPVAGGYHGYIYLTDQLSYSKNGYDYLHPWGFYPISAVEDFYGLTNESSPNCLASFGDNPPPEKCSEYQEYFHCNSYDETALLKKNPADPRLNGFSDMSTKESALECQLSQAAVTGGPAFLAPFASTALGSLVALRQIAVTQSQQESNLPPDVFRFWTMMLRRLDSLGEQFNLVAPTAELSIPEKVQ